MMKNNLYIAYKMWRDNLQRQVIEQALVVAPAVKEWKAKEICLDFFYEWKWWEINLELVAENVPLDIGLYNPWEVKEFLRDKDKDEVFVEV